MLITLVVTRPKLHRAADIKMRISTAAVSRCDLRCVVSPFSAAIKKIRNQPLPGPGGSVAAVVMWVLIRAQ